MPSIDVNGTQINYRVDGPEQAPALLMSNSLGTNLNMWDWQIPDFAQHFRVVRYDARGHGGSAAPAGPYSIEMLAKDALGLLDALGISRANFCGLSMGGMVGQWIGTNAPERLDRLVLCNTSAHMPPRNLWDARIDAALNKGMDSLVETVVDRWFSKTFQQSNPDDVAKVRAMILTTPGIGYAACCMAIRDMDQRDTIRAVSVPTLVIVGSKDPATPPDHGGLIHERITGSTLATLDAAHLSNIEARDAFTKTALSFLLGA